MSDNIGKLDTESCHFVAKMAGLVFDITTVYPSAFHLCKDYLSEEDPTISVSVTKKDIQQEKEKGKVFFYTCIEYGRNEEKQRFIKREINESVIESVVLYRKIIEASIQFGVFFLHGAAIAVRDKAFIFTAPSGTGKTTHILKWIAREENSYIVNGDKPLIRVTESGVIVCGTPWCGNENYGTNTIVPLNSIILMERSDVNHIEEITFKQAYFSLITQIYIPDDKELAAMVLKFVSQLNGRVRFFRFQFNNFREDCFETAFNTLMF